MLKKIVFMGSDAIALPLLKYLHAEGGELFQLEAVVSQPDRPKGRGKKLQPNPIAAWAEEQGLTVLKPEKPRKELRLWMVEQAIDLVVVMAYGHIVSQKLLETPKLGCVNLHASLLPKFRGASPVESAVASGESETGVSLMRMELEMDAGPVLDVERVPIQMEITGASMRLALADATVDLVQRNMAAMLSGEAVFMAQDASQATYCRKLDKADGLLDFKAPARVLVSRINGLYPWPGCYCDFEETRLKLMSARLAEGEASAAAGTVISADKAGVVVATGDGLLTIEQLQRPGGKMLPAQQFLQGFALKAGDVLSGGEMRPLLSA